MVSRAHPSEPRTVLITGATDGVGLLLARSYAARGHRVIATGRRAIADEAAHFGSGRIRYIRADQQGPARAARRIDETLATLGIEALDLVIVNAGTGWAGPAEEETARSLVQQIDINLTASIHIVQAMAARLFAAQGARLVLIGSKASVKGAARFAVYAATKGALDGFGRSLREEWRGRASVSVVHLGPVRTAMHEKAGLKLGASRAFFMSAKAAARAVERAARERRKRLIPGRFYARPRLFGRPGENEL